MGNVCPHQALELALIDACEASGLHPEMCIAVMGHLVGTMMYGLSTHPVDILQMWYANVQLGNASCVAAAETKQ